MNIYHVHEGWPIFEADLELVFWVGISSQDFNSLRVAAPFLRERKNGERFSFVGGKGAATRRLGFQVMLRICLVFPVKISSHQSPVLSFPPWKTIEPEPRRRLVAETQEILSLKSPQRNVTIAWLSSANTFDLLISLSCFLCVYH